MTRFQEIEFEKCGKEEYERMLAGTEVREYRFGGFNLRAFCAGPPFGRTTVKTGKYGWAADCRKVPVILRMEFGGNGLDGEPEQVILRSPFTDFQLDVYRSLVKTGRGELLTYSGLAELSGHPSAIRAVATAMARNRFPVIVPCHRVVPKSGGIGEYAYGRELKRKLIESELESEP